MVLISWTPDYLDPHSNADTFAHNDDDADDAPSRTRWRGAPTGSFPISPRRRWRRPRRPTPTKRKADVRGPAEEGDRRRAVHPHVPAGEPGRLAGEREGLQARHHRGPLLLPDVTKS